MFLFGLILGFIVGVVGTALVYRNNNKKANEVVDNGKIVVDNVIKK